METARVCARVCVRMHSLTSCMGQHPELPGAAGPCTQQGVLSW